MPTTASRAINTFTSSMPSTQASGGDWSTVFGNTSFPYSKSPSDTWSGASGGWPRCTPIRWSRRSWVLWAHSAVCGLAQPVDPSRWIVILSTQRARVTE